MRKRLLLISICIMAVGIMTMFLCKIVWLPDVISGRRVSIARYESVDAGKIVVEQYWNHGDFYSVTLRHITPTGEDYQIVVDPDYPKIWFASIAAQSTNYTLKIRADGSLLGTYQWRDHAFKSRNGVVRLALKKLSTHDAAVSPSTLAATGQSVITDK